LYIVSQRNEFWVTNCACRTSKGSPCTRSRADVCLHFEETAEANPSSRRKITKEEALELMTYAEKRGLVARPYPDTREISEMQGICNCCPDCCSYFAGKEISGKGDLLETTDLASCDGCGLCIGPCHFGARLLTNGAISIDQDRCHGCGLCLETCPQGSIALVPRD
jgi:Pyruvate/2-oxoacid:ferredoxin oxidoreductase delta subunit